MNKTNLKDILVPIRALIAKSRPAYKDYIGEAVEEKTVALAAGTFDGDRVALPEALVEGETYIVTVNGVTQEMVAQDCTLVLGSMGG